MAVPQPLVLNPPRLTGDLRVDNANTNSWLWRFYQQIILEDETRLGRQEDLEAAQADATAALATLADPELVALAALVSAADRLPYFTGSGTAALTTFTAFVRTIADDVDAVTVRATIGLGSLAVLSSVDTPNITDDAVTFAKMQNLSADVIIGAVGAGSPAEISCTAVGRAIIAAATAALQRAALGSTTVGDALFIAVSEAAARAAIGLADSTYTPTHTNLTNLSATTPRVTTYARVGNTVIVGGAFSADPVAPAGATSFEMSLPIASNFANTFECGGTAFSPNVAGQGAGIFGNVANDTAQVQWTSGDIANQEMDFHFIYRVIP